MVSVNIDTTVAEFESYRDDMETLKSALDSLASEYNTSISSINSILASTTFDHWEDAVSVLLKSFVENMKAHVDTISKDISGGGFAALQKTADNLAKQLAACAKEKKRLEEQKENLKKTEKHVKSGNFTIINPVYTMIENNIISLENSLQAKVNICNRLFDFLTTIEFNHTTPDSVPAVDVTEVTLQTDPYDNQDEPIPPIDNPDPPIDDPDPPIDDPDPPGQPVPPEDETTGFWESGLGKVAASVLFVPAKLIEGIGTGVENVILDPAARFGSLIFGDSWAKWADKDWVGDAFDGDMYANAWGGKDSVVNQFIGTSAENIGKAASYAAGAAAIVVTAPVSATTAAVGLAAYGGINAGISKSRRETGSVKFSTVALSTAEDVVNQILLNPTVEALGSTTSSVAQSVVSDVRASAGIRNITRNAWWSLSGHVRAAGARTLLVRPTAAAFMSRASDFANDQINK